MAKAKKGLIISLLTLIIAIVVTTTSTYAWFAMNIEVTATNMQVTAKSDTTYLVIQQSPTGANGKMGNVDTATLALTANAHAVLPSKVKLDNSNVLLTNDGLPTWQTAVGTSFIDGTIKPTTTYTDHTTAASLDVYVVKYTFYVGLNPAVSQFNATNLKLSSLTVANTAADNHADTNNIFFAPMSVLVVAYDGTNYVADSYVNAGASSITANNGGAVTVSNTVLASTVNKDGSPITIDVYVYINGDHANVTTQNAVAANLGTYTCSLGFTVTPGSENPGAGA